jgi:magnesium chelatase subunit I
MTDEPRMKELYKVNGLWNLLKQYFPPANENETALFMEFILHGLSSYSLISKKIINGTVQFKDLIGSMMNLGQFTDEVDDEMNEEDF